MKIVMLGSGSIRSNFMHRMLVLGKALHKLGHEVAIIAPKADKYNDFVPETITEIDGVRILQPFQFATKRLEVNLVPYMLGAARLTLREKADVVYIYKPTPISVVGLVAKLFRRTPTVLDMDDLGSDVMKIEGHPIYQRKLVEWSERLASRFADRLVMASTFLRDYQKVKHPNKPVMVMPNGAEASWLADKPVKSKHHKQVIVFASLNRQNIVEPLFDAMPAVLKAHPTAKVLVIGDGQFMQFFKDKVKKLGLTKAVTFKGWVPVQEARGMLGSGDVGYAYMPDDPTVRAASIMKVAQFMARGVVPLVSNVGDLSWMVDGGKAGYIAKPGDVADLTDVLVRALSEDRSKKAANARAYAQKTLSWDAQAKLVSDMLQAMKREGK